ncbi:MAG: hypothetical protein K1X94_04940 [Sandaracinaceae bacterium]|nr:hypothetical protein [Sandaracinaceae bacterium]
MNPSSTRTLSFVTFAALTALTGCGADPESSTFAARVAAAPLDHVSLEAPAATTSAARAAIGAHVELQGLELGHPLVVGTDSCEVDADCVPDGCHATRCVAAADMAPGELECSNELRYGTTDGGGCLCHSGLCAARLSNPPQGI